MLKFLLSNWNSFWVLYKLFQVFDPVNVLQHPSCRERSSPFVTSHGRVSCTANMSENLIVGLPAQMMTMLCTCRGSNLRCFVDKQLQYPMSGHLCLPHLPKLHDNDAPLREKRYASPLPDLHSLHSPPRSSAAPSRRTLYSSRCAASPFAIWSTPPIDTPSSSPERMRPLPRQVLHVVPSAPTPFRH